jgi:hypothetical protein
LQQIDTKKISVVLTVTIAMAVTEDLRAGTWQATEQEQDYNSGEGDRQLLWSVHPNFTLPFVE